MTVYMVLFLFLLVVAIACAIFKFVKTCIIILMLMLVGFFMVRNGGLPNFLLEPLGSPHHESSVSETNPYRTTGV